MSCLYYNVELEIQKRNAIQVNASNHEILQRKHAGFLVVSKVLKSFLFYYINHNLIAICFVFKIK